MKTQNEIIRNTKVHSGLYSIRFKRIQPIWRLFFDHVTTSVELRQRVVSPSRFHLEIIKSVSWSDTFQNDFCIRFIHGTHVILV